MFKLYLHRHALLQWAPLSSLDIIWKNTKKVCKLERKYDALQNRSNRFWLYSQTLTIFWPGHVFCDAYGSRIKIILYVIFT